MLFTLIIFFQKFAVVLFMTVLEANIGSFIVFLTITDSVGPIRRLLSYPPAINEEEAADAVQAVSRSRDVRVHNAFQRTQRGLSQSFRNILDYENDQSSLDAYHQAIRSAAEAGPEHLAAFTRNTPFPTGRRFAVLDEDARPRRHSFSSPGASHRIAPASATRNVPQPAVEPDILRLRQATWSRPDGKPRSTLLWLDNCANCLNALTTRPKRFSG